MGRLPRISPSGVPVHVIQRERMENYRALFTHRVDEKSLDEIRVGINTGMAIGNDRFKDEIERLTGQRVKPNKARRPVGWRKNMIQN